jgi:hypothetical protein
MFEITTGKISEPFTCLIYGIAGIGKTTLASKAPNPLFIDLEEGTGRIDTARIKVKTREQLSEAFAWAAKQHHQTIVLDSMTAIEKLMIRKLLKENPKWKGTLQGAGYGNGYKALVDMWQEIMNGVAHLKANGKNVICIGHARVKAFADPMTETYDRYEPDIEKQAFSVVHGALDAVLFYRYRTHVRESGDEKRYLAMGGDDRELFTIEQPAFIAKNRYNLEPVIENPTSQLFERMI